MREPGRAFVGWAARQTLLTHVGHGPGGAANVDHLARFRHGRMLRPGACAVPVLRRHSHVDLLLRHPSVASLLACRAFPIVCWA